MTDDSSGPARGGGLAHMTYSTNGAAERVVDGTAATQTWYDENNQPTQAYMQIWVEGITIQFGIEPFTGTGSYSDLPYFMYVDKSLYVPGVTGLYTTSAYPPAPDPPPPDFTVADFNSSATLSAWVAQLTADLVWFSDTVTQPPLTLKVSSLTLSIRPDDADAAGQASDLDGLGREQFAQAAAAHGLQIDPSSVPRR
jgi:hypothetical protein